MSWLIYTLLGVGIIILVMCIIWWSKPPPVKEGMLDYFNIEDYLQTIQATKGRYVRIRPSKRTCTATTPGCSKGMYGDGLITISQIQVLDMNGNNIAEGKTVTATSTATYDKIGSGSADVSVTVDGTLESRSGEDNVWTSGVSDRDREYWQVDLGDVYQISQIIFSGNATNTTKDSDGNVVENTFLWARANGMRCEVLNIDNGNTTTPLATAEFSTSTPYQTVSFPNAINLSPMPTGDLIGALNPSILPINSRQPEVFLLTGSFTTSQAITACGLRSSVLATRGQINEAQKNGARWTQPGLAADGVAYYPSATGVETSAGVTTANASCFGIKPQKPADQNNKTILDFAGQTWSQHVGNTTPKYFGDTTISIPDVPRLYAAVSNKSNLSTPPEWGIARPDLAEGQLYGTLKSSAPLNFLYDEGLTQASTITGLNNSIRVFGSVPSTVTEEINTSISLCSRIFLGLPDDVEKYINVGISDMKPYIRATAGWRNFCRVELVQSVSRTKGDYEFNIISANQTFNRDSKCNTILTSDMLGLIPDPARDFIINWIYNRTKRFIKHNNSVSAATTADAVRCDKLDSATYMKDNACLSDRSRSAAKLTTDLAALRRMFFTVKGSALPIDVTRKYVLDNIAQSFYEAMGGNYTMTQIYDVYTIGGSILDVRFDMTKHADVSALQAQVTSLKNIYEKIRESTRVSQDILDSAKQNYQSAVATLQATASTNVLPVVPGVVGRFFYTYSTATAKIKITGFTLDARAVTSFIPELNCGIQVATGNAEGALNYTPDTVYTRNVPETLVCTDPNVLRRIMEDYVDAAQADLQETLLGTQNSNGSYTGPAGAPSMDTTLGTLYINSITNAVQVSPTQCAIKWTETLWSDLSNQPVSAQLAKVTRRALFSYAVNTVDWYASDIAMDMSGFQFYRDDEVPACTFSPTYYQRLVSPRLDSLNPASAADIKTLRQDFITNAWNNGLGNPCPDTIPNYVFSAADYCAANGDINNAFNAGGKGPLNVGAATSHYANTTNDGIFGGGTGRVVRSKQAITALTKSIDIPQAIPANNILDNGNGACPITTTCEDLNVLYSIVDQYNQNPTLPGSILRVTRAFTANTKQCDIEVDINYDVNVQDDNGKTVKKGSFSYSSTGAMVQVSNLPSGFKKNETRAFTVEVNLADCSYNLIEVGAPGSGTSIQTLTPALYKPMEYATQAQQSIGKTITSSINDITSKITDAAKDAAAVIPKYRADTQKNVKAIAAVVGNLANLTSGAKCSDTALLNSMLTYYHSQGGPRTYTELVSKDYDGQGDILSVNGTPAQCQARCDTLPNCNGFSYAYGVGYLKTIPSNAVFTNNQAVILYKARNRLNKQINTVLRVGTLDSTTCDLTVQEDTLAAGPTTGTINIASSTTTGLRFTIGSGNVPTAMKYVYPAPPSSTADLKYINPAKEAFKNYGPPVQVSESTFPLNKESFGLDMARNRGGPALDTMFEEPLRSSLQGNLEEVATRRGSSYKYLRFRPIQTRYPQNPTVDVGKFRFLLGSAEIDMTSAKVTNPMGSWVGDIGDVIGPGFRRGWSDVHKRSIVFAFPYAMLVDGFTWTTTNPDKGLGGDPVQWKLEGSQNGTYWTVLRDQTKHNYAVPQARFQELPVFRF